MLGESDGTPKTAAWAADECGVPARQIRALARGWARKQDDARRRRPGRLGRRLSRLERQRVGAGDDRPRRHAGPRQARQNLWSTTSGVPFNTGFFFPGYAEGGISGDVAGTAAGKQLASRMWPNGGFISNPQHSTEGQMVPRLRIPEAMRHEKLNWHGKGFCGSSIESQFQKYEYPRPGYPHVQMYYRYGGSFIGTMTETNRYVTAYREGKIPTVVSQAIWMEGETRFADIVLPACTNFERWDIGDWAHASGYGTHKFEQVNHRIIVLQKKCVEPLGESEVDYEIFAALAGKLGIGDIYTEGGLTELDWARRIFEASDLPSTSPGTSSARRATTSSRCRSRTTRPRPPCAGSPRTASATRPHWGPPPWDTVGRKGLQTTTGKIRVRQLPASHASTRRATWWTRSAPPWGRSTSRAGRGTGLRELDREVPAAATLAAPALQLPHARTTARTPGPWTSRSTACSRTTGGATGSSACTPRMRRRAASPTATSCAPSTTAARCCWRAYLTERVRPGTAHCYESCADYEPAGEPGHSPDLAGCINILTPEAITITPTSPGQACNTALIEVERLPDAQQV